MEPARGGASRGSLHLFMPSDLTVDMAENVQTCNLHPGIFRPLFQVWTTMPPTSDERLVLLRLQEHGVVKQAELAEQLHLSPKALQRLLPKVGYYRSLNHNSAFVALAATPRFDDCGL